ncbi:MAG: ABC transporter ATP-binding protein [Devosia sp.]
MASSIALRDVYKRYGDIEVVHGLDLTIEPGEFTVFVGPSGCGKSTLLRMIAGLEPISGGDLLIDGQRMNEVPASKRGIAMVFQSYALYPHMSVYQNLAFGLETARLPRQEIEARVKRVAEILRIEPLLKRKPRQLSGGQRQRVAIGRAIAREPHIYLFDEPLSNLDAELRVQMRVEIAQIHHDLGNTMIYVTHDQVEAMTMANKIVVLNAGIIEQIGAPLELYNNPRNRFVAGFLGSPKMNFIESTVTKLDGTRGTVNVGGTQFQMRQSLDGFKETDKVVFGIRPEHMGLTEAAGVKLADVRVDLIEHLGDQTMLYASTNGGQSLTLALAGQQHIDLGSTVTAYVDPSKYHAFGPDGRAL